MKLQNPVTITPPPYSDNSGNVINPPPIVFDELKITILDNLWDKNIAVRINGIPLPIPIFSKQQYESVGEPTRQDILNKLAEKLKDDPAKFLRSYFNKTLEETPNHPGTVLSKMIKSVGIQMTDSCACRRHALEMNAKGNDWCEQNIDTVVGWLRQEAKNRGLPFIDALGKLIVNRAIKKSRKLLANQPVPDNDEDLDHL